MENILRKNKRCIRTLCLAAAAALACCPLFAEESLPPPEPAVVVLQPAERANLIAFKLNNRLGDIKGNAALSPYGLYSAFAMAYDGARETTAAEMLGAFSFPEDRETLRREAVQLRRRLIKAVKGAEFRRVNAYWYQKGYELTPEYEAVLKSSYSASGENADFRSSPEKARAAINTWTEKQTGGRITGIFEEGSVTQLTRLTLVNAVYFKGRFKNYFSSAATSEQDFFPAAGEAVKAQLMVMKNPAKINYYEDEELQAAGLDYLGGGLRLLVLLPAQGKSAAELGKALSQEKLAEIKTAMAARIEPVLVSLPRFKFASSWDLISELSALGMPAAFSEKADFSGMAGRKGLYLQKAVQKVFVEVDEGGEAAAAAPKPKKRAKKPLVFRADRPFLFLIEDKRTGLLLFTGRLEDPSK